MKKFELFALIALAMAACACNKEIEQPGDDPVTPIEPGKIVFTAQAPTKTATADDQTVTWVTGDEVRFSWDGGYTTATAASSGASTTFTIDAPDDATEIYAIYPASAGGSVNNGKVTVHYSGSRADGSFAANDICVARAVKNGDAWETSLAFKNAACLLKIGVTSSEIVKLRVEAVGGEEISGAFEVNMDENGNPVVGAAIGTAGDKSSMTVSGPGNYYIPIKPGVTLTEGFRVSRFIDDSNQITPFYYYGSFTTARGQIIKLNDIDAHAGQFYVTPDGAGTLSGQSWSNAMSAEKFKTLVENQDNYFIIKGSTFHFSAENFTFGNDYVKPAYPDHGNVAFTLEGTVTATDTTTFLGRTATSGTTAGVLWPQQNSYITIKNVKFTGTNGASNASAIRLNNSAKELNLDHCYFRNNKTAGNGASISLFNSATVNIKDCSFSNNTGCGGGIIHVNNASAKVNIQDSEAKGITKNAIFGQSFDTFTCTRVTFKDNDDAGEYGAAAYLCGSGTITFNDCDFIRNHSSNRGGAICIRPLEDGATTDVSCTFKDCEFIDNWSDQRGGAVMIERCTSTTTFSGGKFQGNHADGSGDNYAGGAICVVTGAFDCTDVLFKENYSFTGSNTNAGGIIRLTSSGDGARFDNCVFDNNWSCRSASNNASCAAIINCRNGGTKFYFNACEFKNNSSGRGYSSGNEQGGKSGQVMAVWAGATIGMNNCSMHDNFASRNVDDGSIYWICMGNANSKLILSNSSIIGDQVRRPESTDQLKSKNGVIRLDAECSVSLINSIICSNYSDGKSVGCKATYNVPAYYCKVSPGLDGDTNWTNTTGFGSDYWADSSCFGGWSAPWTWNGTLTGTNSNMLAATADVNTEIQTADADFYAWLNSIGALGKDINGNSRGATSWPGCYQQ